MSNKKYNYNEIMETVFLLQFGLNEIQLGHIEHNAKKQQEEDIDVWLYPTVSYSNYSELARSVSVKHNKSGLRYGSVVLEVEKFNSSCEDLTLTDSWFNTGSADIYAFAMTDLNNNSTPSEHSYWFIVKADKLKEVVKTSGGVSLQKTRLSDYWTSYNKNRNAKFDCNYSYHIKVSDLLHCFDKSDYEVVPICRKAFKKAKTCTDKAIRELWSKYAEEAMYDNLTDSVDFEYIEESCDIAEKYIDRLVESGSLNYEDYAQWFRTKE